MKQRSTIDIVVIIMAGTVGVVLIISVIGILVLRITRPEADVSAGATAVGRMTEILITALIAFVGGRATGRIEEKKANGVTHDH